MHYVIGDVHNDNRKLQSILKQISFGPNDHVYLLGDLFDRGGTGADPVGVYFTVLKLEERCTVVRGNHDQWLAAYINYFDSLSEKEQSRCIPYMYNSFDMIRQRLTPVDMLHLETFIHNLPVQAELELEQKYLFAHAMTSPPDKREKDTYYLDGDWDIDKFITDGIPGYISFCGHDHTSNFSEFQGEYCDEENSSIWRNKAGNVYMMDCGCGFESGRLACMCLENGKRFYE